MSFIALNSVLELRFANVGALPEVGFNPLAPLFQGVTVLLKFLIEFALVPPQPAMRKMAAESLTTRGAVWRRASYSELRNVVHQKSFTRKSIAQRS